MKIEKVLELVKKSKEELSEIRWNLENDLNDDMGDLKRKLNKGMSFTNLQIVMLINEISDYLSYLDDLNLVINSKGE